MCTWIWENPFSELCKVEFLQGILRECEKLQPHTFFLILTELLIVFILSFTPRHSCNTNTPQKTAPKNKAGPDDQEKLQELFGDTDSEEERAKNQSESEEEVKKQSDSEDEESYSPVKKSQDRRNKLKV